MRKKLPPLGLRIIKSSVGVFLGFIIYYLRGCQGTPFYTSLAVLWCMRSNIKDSRIMAKQRVIGTFIGGIYGFIILLLVLNLHLTQFMNLMISSFMIIPIIYTTLLIKKKNASYFACVVFLSIVVNHYTDANPYLFVFNRILDTLIGIILSLIINQMHIPRRKNKDILFVSGIDDVLLNSNHFISDYSLRQINCMIDDGMLFTVSSMQTVPVILENTKGIHIQLPVIAMNGAVLFDIQKKKYIKKIEIPYDLSKTVIDFIRKQGFHVFINSIYDDSWLIYYSDFQNDVEKMIYHQLKTNPYRNYMKHDLIEGENTVYLLVIDEKAKVEKLYHDMLQQLDTSQLRLLCYDSQDYPGYAYLKIYDHLATRAHMLEELMDLLDVQKVKTFGSLPNCYDVTIDNQNGNLVAKTLDRLYQPFIFTQDQQ